MARDRFYCLALVAVDAGTTLMVMLDGYCFEW
jgi:hypothetical protein